MRKFVFDTQALLKYYLDESSGAQRVEEHLSRLVEKKELGYINLVTLTEFYYILYRSGIDKAEEKERNLRSFGIKIVPVRDNSKLWKMAATIKAQHSLSLADAFGSATAIVLKGVLVTGTDSEFDSVENLKIERL
jgi:predicted nucleic acid-binding protein